MTFRVVDAGGTGGEIPPYAIGTEFLCEFRIDAADIDDEGAKINAASICVEFNSVDLQVISSPPFTLGDYFPTPIPLQNNSPQAGQLALSISDFTGGDAIDDGLIATVTFRQLSNTHPVAVTFCGLQPSDPPPNTRYTKTTDPSVIVPNTNNGDHSLPVSLTSFTATATDDTVALQWRTASEVNNLGFNIYRSETPNGTYEKITPTLIRGAGTDVTPHDYQFVDLNIEPEKVYYYYIEDVDFMGVTGKSALLKVDAARSVIHRFSVRPTRTMLLQNFPNPFNPETWIPFHLANDSQVRLQIYNVRGLPIRTLDLGYKPAGYYDTHATAAYWDGKDGTGQGVGSGLYLYSLQSEDFVRTQRMIIVK